MEKEQKATCRYTTLHYTSGKPSLGLLVSAHTKFKFRVGYYIISPLPVEVK